MGEVTKDAKWARHLRGQTIRELLLTLTPVDARSKGTQFGWDSGLYPVPLLLHPEISTTQKQWHRTRMIADGGL